MLIAGRTIGLGSPLFVIAELGLNHGGSPEQALRLVEAAAGAGASAVKLQTLTGATLVAPDCPAPAHVAAASLGDFFRRFELDAEAHAEVARLARARGLAFMSTPFHLGAVDLLEAVGVDAYKIASGDLTNAPLLERVAATGRPLVLSTGLATLGDIGGALDIVRRAGAADVALLHCVSAYPVPQGTENLRAIATLALEFGVPVGLSDHGTDPMAAALTVALGGGIYEKHLVLAPGGDEVDAAVSATPESLGAIVRVAERARRALGDGRKVCLSAEQPNLAASRRSLHATRALAAGDLVGEGDIIALRPGLGLDPRRWRELVGRPVGRAMRAGERFVEADLVRSIRGEARRDVA